MMHDQENLFEIIYDRDGETKGKTFEPKMPDRPADFIQVMDVAKTHTGEQMEANHFWFAEGRMININNYYNDEAKETSLQHTESPGVCNMCPNSGHLMFINERSYQGWEFVRKDTQEAFVAWLTEQTLLDPDSN